MAHKGSASPAAIVPPWLVKVVLAVPAISAIAIYIFIGASRLAYPFTLEWIEANTFIHVVRVMQGQPLYVAPSFDFIPLIYTPLYFYVAAPLAGLSGHVMLAMRLVSLLASFACLALIYALGRTQRLAPTAGLLAAGLFAAGYGFTGFWLDLGRVDTLFLALLLAAYWLAVVRTQRQGLFGIAAGLALWLACATKQTGVVAFPFLCLYLVIQRRWARLVAFGLTFGVTLVTWGILANAASGGWFWVYTVQIPQSHPLLPSLFTGTWRNYLLPRLYPLLILMGLAAAFAALRRDRPWLARYGLFLGCLAAPFLLMALLNTLKIYSYLNGLIPAMAGLALAGAEAAHWLVEKVGRQRWLTAGVTLGSLFLVGLQFVQLRYAIQPQLPTAADQWAGEAVVALLRQAPAPVTSALSPHLLYLAGRPIQYQTSSAGDLYEAAQYSPALAALLNPYLAALQQRSREQVDGTFLVPDDQYTQSYSTGPYTCRSLAAEGLLLRQFTGAQAYNSWLCIHTGQ